MEESTAINVQKAALYFGILNLLVGLAGFFGPFFTGNRDGLINIETGHLFAFLAIDWPHAGAMRVTNPEGTPLLYEMAGDRAGTVHSDQGGIR